MKSFRAKVCTVVIVVAVVAWVFVVRSAAAREEATERAKWAAVGKSCNRIGYKTYAVFDIQELNHKK